MRTIRTAFIAMAAIGAAALSASAANAQYAPRDHWRGDSTYSYRVDRVAPHGWDQDNPRDQQLQGTR